MAARRRKTLTERLDKRITIQQKSTSRAPNAIVKETWSDVVTVFASVEPMRGREYFQAAAVNAESMIRFRIRYRPGIRSDMRVLYAGRIYSIESPPIDPFDQREELELMCREVGING